MLSSELIRKIAFLLFVLLFPVEVWALPTKAVEVRLESTVNVASETVVLGDVATIYAKSMRDFQTLSQLTLSKIPESGELRLPQGYLEGRIREVLPAGTTFQLHAPSQVVFRLATLGISPEEFAAEILKRARSEGRIPEWAEAQIEPVGGFDQLKLWRGNQVRIDPAAEMPRWKGEMAFKVAPLGKSDLAWVKVKVRWFAEAWVAKRALGILSPLRPEDFESTRVEVTALREDPLLVKEDLNVYLRSARARRSIAAANPLTAQAIERAPDAKAGQPLRVVFVSESGIRVSAEGALIGAGIIGNEAKAKLRTSRKIITGKLVSENLMEVSL